jgi:hypothetical protein
MIKDTVGLWGIPVNRFRIFKVRIGEWHVVYPNKMFADAKTTTGNEAIETVRRKLRGGTQ